MTMIVKLQVEFVNIPEATVAEMEYLMLLKNVKIVM
tara:strand:- start:163 stop:270 length:108 start_codon:yes stop_codon:yes gene_type:complete